jgi:hypothetical protein
LPSDRRSAVDHPLLEGTEVEPFTSPHNQLAVENAVTLQLAVQRLVDVGELVGQVRSGARPQSDRAAAANDGAATS